MPLACRWWLFRTDTFYVTAGGRNGNREASAEQAEPCVLVANSKQLLRRQRRVVIGYSGH